MSPARPAPAGHRGSAGGVLGVVAVAVVVALLSAVLGVPTGKGVAHAAAGFLGGDGARSFLARTGGGGGLQVEWARNDSIAILESGPESFGVWVTLALVDVRASAYARLTTMPVGDDDPRIDRLLTLDSDGVRTNVVQERGEPGVTYVPGKVTLPANLAPGARWASAGDVRRFDGGRFSGPTRYESEATAEVPADAGDAARGCLVVTETERVGSATATTSATWCPGAGILAYSDGTAEYRVGERAPEPATATDDFDWTMVERLTWRTLPVSHIGRSLVSPTPVAAPGVLADGSLVFASKSSGDVVAILPERAAEPSVWRARAGGTITTAATLGGLTVVVTTERMVTAFGDDGGWLWSTRVPDVARIAPLRYADGVLVATLDGTLSLLDPVTGAARWTYQTDGDVAVPPVVVGDALVVGDQSGALTRLGPDGTVVWSVQAVKADRLVVAGDTVVVTPHAGSVVHAYRIDDGAWAWELRPGTAFDDAVGLDAILVMRTHEELFGYEPGTGRLVWRLPVVSYAVTGSADRLLVVLDRELLVVDAVGGQILSRAPHELAAATAAFVYVAAGPGQLVVTNGTAAAIGVAR